MLYDDQGQAVDWIYLADANIWDGATILHILRVHPMMVVHGHVVQNPYYMTPEEYLRKYCAA
jgi:hypothetical protein